MQKKKKSEVQNVYHILTCVRKVEKNKYIACFRIKKYWKDV